MRNLERTPLQSKKFIAYMITNLIMKTYMFYSTYTGESDTVVITAIFLSVFLDVGYILGQAAVDSLVRYASIITDSVKNKLSEITKDDKEDKEKEEN
jgi:hypothetical protein